MKSVKVMILGIAIILVSLIIQGEPGIRFYGNEVFIGLFGFILVCTGLFMEDKH
ncbi:hypothetical protein [Paenibacillus zeisoli]|uniref:hypothetical protein n=1 Tax=Paenibacillus zeisoli TaxID=2496267 RepID=UPI00163BD5B6|nr:hypothetical protein [Paenibacillus zeisoli]